MAGSNLERLKDIDNLRTIESIDERLHEISEMGKYTYTLRSSGMEPLVDFMRN